MIYLIDLFCGGGGTSTGAQKAEGVEVIYCVNHDSNAIKSHAANHPNCIHKTEDILILDLGELSELVWHIKRTKPSALIGLWASLECTNFSKAKGGLPRDADSRTLANGLFRYVESLPIDIIYIENVIEFMSWGPLCELGKPVSKRKGSDYVAWVEKMKSYGFLFDNQYLNSADYGAYTARRRYFAQFAKPALNICWPEVTHSKTGTEGKQKYKAVREVLDLQDHGESIFKPGRIRSDKTFQRIYAGLVKFVANGDDRFIKKYFSGRPEGKVISVNQPAGTVTTIDHQAVVKVDWLLKYNSINGKSGKHIPPSLEEPCPTIATQGRLGIVNAEFLSAYYGTGANVSSLNDPCPTVSTKDRFAKILPQFLTNNYSNGGITSGINLPCGTLATVPKQNLTTVQFMDQQYGQSKPTDLDSPNGTLPANPKNNVVTCNFLMNPQWYSKGGNINEPCFTLIARMDKTPPYLITTEEGYVAIPVFEDDTEYRRKVKEFMALYGIVDIKMRMLKIVELKQIQGFPKDYILIGTEKDQKKFIGNAVEVTQAEVILTASYRGNLQHLRKVI